MRRNTYTHTQNCDVPVHVTRNEATETKESERNEKMRRREIFRRLRDGAAKIIEKRKAFEKMKTPEKIVTRDTIEDQMRALKSRLSALKNLQTKRDQLTSEEAKWTHTVDAYLRDVKSHAASKQGDSDMESTNIPMCLEKLFEDVTEIIQRRNAFEAEKTEKSVTCETISDQIRSDCGPRPNEAMRKHAAYYGKSMDELMSSRKAVLEELQRKEDGLGIEEARWEATMDAYERIDGLASRSVPIVGRLRKRRRVCYRDVDARESIQYKVDQVVEIQNGPDDVRATIVRVTGDSVTVRYHSDNFEETIIGEDRQDRILRIVDDDDASDGEPSKSSATTVTANRLDDETIVYEEGQVVKVKYGDNPLRATIVRVEGDSVTVRCRVDNSEETIVGEDRRHRILRIPGTNDACDKEPSKSSAAPVTPNASMSVPARGKTSKYRGVCIHSSTGPTKTYWHAQLAPAKFSKRFENEEEAAKAYDDAARKHYGPSAVTNFLLNGEPNHGIAVTVSTMSSRNASQVTPPTATSVAPSATPRNWHTRRNAFWKEMLSEMTKLHRNFEFKTLLEKRRTYPTYVLTYRGQSVECTERQSEKITHVDALPKLYIFLSKFPDFEAQVKDAVGSTRYADFYERKYPTKDFVINQHFDELESTATASAFTSPASARTSALRMSAPAQTARKTKFTKRQNYLRRRGWKIIEKRGQHYEYEAPGGRNTFSSLAAAWKYHKKHHKKRKQ